MAFSCPIYHHSLAGETCVEWNALFIFQLEVSVRDNDPTNPLTAMRNAFVTVNIVRNENVTQFVDTVCEISLNSQNNQGFPRQVTDTDDDDIVSPVPLTLNFG